MERKKLICICAFLCAAGFGTGGILIPNMISNNTSIVEADDAVYEGFMYTVFDGKATITGYSPDLDLSDVVIPDVIKDGEKEIPVAAIGDRAFYSSTAVKIKVGNNVKTIGAYAFARCTSLKELDLGKNVTTIGTSAIGSYRQYSYSSSEWNISLDKLIIPDRLLAIGDNIFSENPSGELYTTFNELVISDSVQDINSIFYNSSGLTKITVDDNNKVYSSDEGILFDKKKKELIKCPKMTSIVTYELPETVKQIDSQAFYNCSSIKTLHVNDAATTIGDYAFARCTGLKELKLGKSVTTLGKSAIGSYRQYSYSSSGWHISLDKLIIPDKLLAIGDNIFSENPSGELYTTFNELVISDSVQDINSIFYNSSGLTKITVDDNNKVYSSDEGILYDKEKKELIRCPKSTSILTYDLPETVKEIDAQAFYNCPSIKILNVNDDATTIGDYAFARCTGLKELKLGKSVNTIGKSAIGSYRQYSYSSSGWHISLDKLIIPDKLLAIGADLFSENPSGELYTTFNELVISDSVQDINSIFYNSSALAKITVDDDNKVYSSDEGILYDKEQKELIRCPKSTSIVAYELPETVDKIDAQAFYNCPSIKTLHVNDAATTIGDYAFARCTGLKELKLGKSVNTIGKSAIGSYRQYSYSSSGWQTSLDKLEIPDALLNIGDNLFCENPSGKLYTTFKELVISESVTDINSMFYNHSTLTNISVNSGNKNYFDDKGILYTADKKTLIKCPQSSSLLKYDVLSSTNTISGSAFANTKVQTILIPRSVSSIGDNVFSGSGLQIIMGSTGSYAETYAATNNIKFEATEEAATTEAPTTTVADVTTAATTKATAAAITTAATTKATAAVTTAATTKATAAVTTAATTTSATVKTEGLGDLNGDTNLTTSDVRIILQGIVGSVKLTDDQQKKADIDGDGKISTIDAVRLLRFIVGDTETL